MPILFKSLSAVAFVLLCITQTAAKAQMQSAPPELQLLANYILKPEHYPESYMGKHYRVRVKGFALGEVEGDGGRLVFLLIDPHYHQTAPIQIYRLGADGQFSRIIEALAPGPLIPRDDQRLDVHTLRLGIDFGSAKGPNGEDRLAAMALAGIGTAHMVLYKHFIHMEGPDDPPGFIDVSDREEFSGVDECESLQFSQPTSIAAGAPGATGQTGTRLAAIVGQEVYVYAIARVGGNGLLEKTLSRLTLPPGAQEILRMADGGLGLVFADGHSEPLQP